MFIQRINKAPHTLVFDKLVETFGDPSKYIYPKIAQWELDFILKPLNDFLENIEEPSVLRIYLSENENELFVSVWVPFGAPQEDGVIKIDFDKILNEDVEELFKNLAKAQEEKSEKILESYGGRVGGHRRSFYQQGWPRRPEDPPLFSEQTGEQIELLEPEFEPFPPPEGLAWQAEELVDNIRLEPEEVENFREMGSEILHDGPSWLNDK